MTTNVKEEEKYFVITNDYMPFYICYILKPSDMFWYALEFQIHLN